MELELQWQLSLVLLNGIGTTVAVDIAPVSVPDLNATIRCFVPDINIDPGFIRNDTNENIDPSFIRNDSSFVNPCIDGH
jgi:hypothetical protein